MRFVPPGPDARARAIGPTEGLPEAVRRALSPEDAFAPVPVPRRHDWLACHRERGQGFDDYLRYGANVPEGARRTIHLQPLGLVPELPIASLVRFTRAYFQLPVEVLPPLDVQGLTTRRNPLGGQLQVLAGDVLDTLRARLHRTSFCTVGITMEDLYPGDAWNYVFGQASLRERVGVYSLARYLPRFHGAPEGPEVARVVLERSCKVLAHETGHMFGIQHCVWFHCLMNGSNHLSESDARPLHECPVDLRKLWRAIGFDVERRYAELAGFWRDHGVVHEADWLEGRLQHLHAGAGRVHRSAARADH